MEQQTVTLFGGPGDGREARVPPDDIDFILVPHTSPDGVNLMAEYEPGEEGRWVYARSNRSFHKCGEQ